MELNITDQKVRDGDAICMELWGVGLVEASDIRLATFFETELRFAAKHGRGDYSDAGKRRKSEEEGYLTPGTWRSLTRFGVVQRGGKNMKAHIDLDLLDWCLSHPCVTSCVDPG